MKKIVLFLFIISHNLTGQDFVYKDYTNLQTILNPALAGSSCGPRLSLNGQSITFNSAFSPTYRPFNLNFDMPVKLSKGYTLGLGFRYFNYFSGTTVGTIGGTTAVSLNKKITTSKLDHTISIAVEGAINKRSIGLIDIRWPSEIGPNGFEPLEPLDPDSERSIVYGDVNLGIAWNIDFSDHTSLIIGTSIYHINKPNISLFSNVSRISIRTQWHAAITTKITDKIDLTPTAFYTKQGKSDTYNFGFQCGYKYNKNTRLIGGLGYAKNNQPYITAAVDLQKLSISLGYDFRKKANLTNYEAAVAYRFKECD